MARPLARVLVAAMVLAAGVSASPIEGAQSSGVLSEDWKRVRSTNFVVMGNAGEKHLRAALAELERFRHALLTLWPSLKLEPTVPTVLVLFRDDASLTRFKPRNERGKLQRNVAGYFAKHGDVNHLVAAVWPDRGVTFDVIFHEYTHYVIYRMRGPLPAWVDEGLAEFYSTFHTDREGRGLLGQIPPFRLTTLRSGEPLLPLERLLTNEGAAKAFRSDAEADRFYARAWALVHYSILGPRTGQLDAYLNAIDRGLSSEAAFREAYKASFEDLERELRGYLNLPQLPALLLTLPENGAAAVGPVERMLETDALALQGDLLMRTGADDEAEGLLKKALAIDARHAAARVALAGVWSHRRRRDEAIAALQAVAAEQPRDFASRYWLAVNLSQTGRYEEAAEAWTSAVAINARSADAWFELSVAAAALGRSSQAHAALMQARGLDADPSMYRRRAHRLFEVGQSAAIVSDVAAYVREAGWGNEGSPYMAFLGALAHWRLKQPAAAEALLARAAEVVAPGSWSAVVASFLRGTLTSQAFIEKARDAGERTEARAYAGLKASIAGQRDEAIAHLTWVKDRGSRACTEYRLADAELRRLQASPSSTDLTQR